MVQQHIQVWDIFVRVFHWSLALVFAIAWLSAEEIESLHVYAGYAIAGLVAMRLVWGFIGTRHARFSDFAYRPAEVKAFVKDTLLLRARRYIGHNPAGGLMIFLMLAALAATALTGMALYGAEDHAGPLAGMAATLAPFEHSLEEVHEFFANLMLFLVVVHVAGVAVESLLHGENLARAMLTGRKRA